MLDHPEAFVEAHFEPIFTWIHWDKRSYGPDYAVNRPQMTLKHFPWVYYVIICHVGPPWGHSGTHGGLKMAQNSTIMALHDQKWPFMTRNGLCKGLRVVQHDKLLCNIPMASVLGPFRVM